jgi:3-oxoacyl-[acyl-carrier-protein] synthase II
VGSTKGLLGHTIGASGAIEAAVTALSVSCGTVHGCAIPDPIDDLRIAAETTHTRVTHALSVSYGFGGHNGGLLLRRVDADG